MRFAFFAIAIVTIIILAPQSIRDTNTKEFNIHNDILLGFSGDENALNSFLKDYGFHAVRIGEYYLVEGEGYKSETIAYGLPPYIEKNIFFLKEGVCVSHPISFSVDPFQIGEVISAYGIPSIGHFGKNFTGVILVPYGDPQLNQNLNQFDSKFNIYGDGKVSVMYFPSSPVSPSGSWVQETDLDVEVMHATAPDANILVVVTPDDNSTTLEFALDYIVRNHLGDVVSMSWGGPELQVYDQYFHSIIKMAAEKGITLVAASGDTPVVQYPASDPYVLSVGGTTLHILNGNYYYENTWPESGGGNSSIFQKPVWQVGAGLDTYSHRGVPDISIDADPASGVYIYSNGLLGMGGTSLSAPLMAGIILDIDSKLGYSLGFFTPQLYYMHQYNAPKFFNPIYTEGGISFLWKTQTGLGSPIAKNWNFSEEDFYTSVFLGNYTNVKGVYFKIRAITSEPYHQDDEFSFYIMLSGVNSIIFGYRVPENVFFYMDGNKTLTLMPVKNNLLYSVELFNNGTVIINGILFKLTGIPGNFSLYTYGNVRSGEGFCTNLGPAEFRDFEIQSNDELHTPDKIISAGGKGAYGSFELPFIYNDFLIGDVGNYAENILWPRNFTYLQLHNVMLNTTTLNYIPWIVGTGSPNDPYIISGIKMDGNTGIIINLNGSIMLDHVLINAFYGIVIIKAGSIIILNSKIISFVGIQSMNCQVIIENSTILSIFPIVSIFSPTYIRGSEIFSLVTFNAFFEIVLVQDSWIISPFPFIINYFLSIVNILFIFISIVLILVIWKKRRM